MNESNDTANFCSQKIVTTAKALKKGIRGDANPEKVMDFNPQKCQSLRFRVFREGHFRGFKIKAWKIYYYFLKVIHFPKV